VEYEYATNTPEHIRFERALRVGMGGLTPAERDRVAYQPDMKAMSEADSTRGGFLASPEFASTVLRISVAVSPVRSLARVVLSGGSGLFQPIRGAVQPAMRVTETGSRAASTDYDAALSVAQVPVHDLMTSTILSRSLLDDSQYDLATELADMAARSMALTEGTEFVTGTGVGEMEGLNAQSLPADQVVSTTGTSSTIALTDLFSLEEALPEAYQAGATLVLSRKALTAIRKLQAATANPYLMQDAPGTVLGYSYVVLPDLGDPGTTGNVVAYLGDFYQAFTLVQRLDMTVQRVNEQLGSTALAESGKVAFVIYSRSGGQVVVTSALARLQCA
jgi:HK97 family phage major capsid protein